MDTGQSRRQAPPNREEICGALSRYFGHQSDIAAAYLFGSRARGDERRDSDIDVGLFFMESFARDPAYVLERRATIASEIEEIFALPVDVTDLDRVSPLVFHVLFADARLVFDADPDRRMLAILRQDKLYQDELGLMRERMEYVRRRLG